MATVSGLTAAKALELAGLTIVAAEFNGSNELVLTKQNGAQINVGSVPGAIPDASETTKGKIEIATAAETEALTDTTRAVTPASMATMINTIKSRLDVVEIETLPAASYSQSTALSSYPLGLSRIYFGSGEATNWDFVGKVGEVVTYYDGADFARQTWVRHFGGSTNITETWVRTSNVSSGWCKWLVVAEDTGWISATVSGGHTATVAVGYRRRNGVVYLKGAMSAPYSGNANYTTAFTLPTGFRPAENKMYGASSNTATTMSLQVNSNGTVATWMSGSTSAWFPLSGAIFPID